MSKPPLSPRPEPLHEPEPSGIAADDAGATSLAEKTARRASEKQIDGTEKAKLGAEASREEDA